MWHVNQQIAVDSNTNASYWSPVTLTVVGYNKGSEVPNNIWQLPDKNWTGHETLNQSMTQHTETAIGLY